jgi:hypothetical protein
VHKDDPITLNLDGEVEEGTPNPDKRPVRWEDLRGVIVRITDLRTGEVRRPWVSAGEIAERRRRGSDKGPWQSDPIPMARAAAIKVLISTGVVPQAPIPIPIPNLREWYATAPAPALTTIDATPARALPAPAEPDPADAPEPLTIHRVRAALHSRLGAKSYEAIDNELSKQFALLQIAARTTGETVDRNNLTVTQADAMIIGTLDALQPPPAAPTGAQTAPAAPDVSAPAEAEPAATEPPATAGEGAQSALLLAPGDLLALCKDVTAAAFDDRVVSNADADGSAREAVDAWLVGMAKAGRAPTIEAARAAMPRLIIKARDLAGNPPAREA